MSVRSTRTTELHIPAFVRSVITKLHGAGYEAYVVGGAVRDLCMGRDATDWDVTTSASAEEIASVFKDLRSFSLKHETVTLVHRGRHYEVTPFRGPELTLEDDLRHRDFTINAMAYDIGKSLIIDPWGGRRDIEKGVVRGVANPEERFHEDPLRLLRAVRFAVEFEFRIEGRTLRAISLRPEAIAAAAPERIRDELIRILVCERPSQGLQLLRKTGLLPSILPELGQAETGKGRVVDQAGPDAALRLSAFFCAPVGSPSADHGKKCCLAAASVMHRLCFSKSMIREVVKLVQEERALADYDPSWSDGDLRRFIRKVGVENLDKLIALRKANLAGRGRGSEGALRRVREVQRRVKGLIKAPFVSSLQDLAINGSTVMKITGLPQGPEVGAILRHLSEELMDHPEWNTRTKLAAMLKKMKPSTLSHQSEALGKLQGTASRLKTRAQPKP